MKNKNEVMSRKDAIENKYLKIIYSDLVEDINYSDDYKYILVKIFNIDGWERLQFKKNYTFRNSVENELKIRDVLMGQIQEVKLRKKEKQEQKVNDQSDIFKIVIMAQAGYVMTIVGVPLANILCYFVVPTVFITYFLESTFYEAVVSSENYGPYAKFKEMIEENKLRSESVRNDLKPKVKSK